MQTVTRLADLFMPGFELKPFKPCCWYQKELDWMLYIARDCSYVATRTADPYIELLKNGEEVVGIKILCFSKLPRSARSSLLEWTGMDLDDIKGIEDIWILNLEETAPEFEEEEVKFFEELRRRYELGLIVD